MTRIICACALAAAIGAALAEAGQSGQIKPPSQTEVSTQSLTIRGCLRGGILIPTDTGILGPGYERYTLAASKEMMAEIKKHSGHEDEITGTIRVDTATAGTLPSSKKIGPGRLIVRRRTSRDPIPVDANRERLQVEAIVHLMDRCP